MSAARVEGLIPSYFITSKLPFRYDPEAECPRFMQFLHDFCEGHKDRKQFIRSWLNAVVHSRVELQVFLYVLGPGGTGKSLFALVVTAMVGPDATVTTTLKALHSDQFELINLRGKKLILVSEVDGYKGDIGMTVLKALIGNDALRGRVKHVQGATEMRCEGLVMMVGNHPLYITDISDAILRRMLVFHATHVSQSRVPLLFYDGRTWSGPLSAESSGIFNWLLGIDSKEVSDYLLKKEEKVSSFREEDMETQALINPLAQWAREELEPGEGAYIGYGLQEGSKGALEMARRRALYPTYEAWMRRRGRGRPLSHVRFSTNLIETLKKLG